MVPGDRIEQWIPLTAGSHYQHGGYTEVWTAIGSQQPFNDTCRCNDYLDNGAGLSWTLSIPAGSSRTVSHLTAFSPTGDSPIDQEPVRTTIVANPSLAQVVPGAQLYLKLSAKLTDLDAVPVSGKNITFAAGNALVCTAKTNALGDAACGGVVGALKSVLNLGYTARFAGDDGFVNSSAMGSLVIVNGVKLLK
jgi:hypothetical protein